MNTIRVKVKPRSASSELSVVEDGVWTARIRSRPVDGKANEELIALIARHFGLPRSRVSIKSGRSGRMKTLVVDDTGAG